MSSLMRNAFLVTILMVTNVMLLPCKGSANCQFEGRPMNAWLADLAGVPEAPDKPFPTEATQKNALAAFRRMDGQKFNCLVDILSSSTNAGPNMAIILAFK